MTTPLSLPARIRSGLKHRLLCCALLLAPLPFFAHAFVREPALVNLPSILACLMGAALGFMAPLILPQGRSRPMPSSQHLALCAPVTEKLLLALVAGLIAIPFLLRLLGSA